MLSFYPIIYFAELSLISFSFITNNDVKGYGLRVKMVEHRLLMIGLLGLRSYEEKGLVKAIILDKKEIGYDGWVLGDVWRWLDYGTQARDSGGEESDGLGYDFKWWPRGDGFLAILENKGNGVDGCCFINCKGRLYNACTSLDGDSRSKEMRAMDQCLMAKMELLVLCGGEAFMGMERVRG
ncbi:unnamed protein product [Dovyalis caffra]|uniref:Uncharacterized protein n=1 Tax=Dovyalis caffra TaxID=77055 RepID=A0AAV1RIH6_9ROSI|nr:unnamed protein product [Dovyalis caffra]